VLGVRKATSVTIYLYYDVRHSNFCFKQSSSKVMDVSVCVCVCVCGCFFFFLKKSYMQPVIGRGVPVVVSFDYILFILTDRVSVCVCVKLCKLCK